VGVVASPEHSRERDPHPVLIGCGDGAHELVDTRDVGAEQLHDLVVAIGHVALRGELDDPDRQRLGQAVQQLLTGAQCFVRRHLARDVDDLAPDAALVGVVEEVVVGDLEPGVL
jgi:hypothetical protein